MLIAVLKPLLTKKEKMNAIKEKMQHGQEQIVFVRILSFKLVLSVSVLPALL